MFIRRKNEMEKMQNIGIGDTGVTGFELGFGIVKIYSRTRTSIMHTT